MVTRSTSAPLAFASTAGGPAGDVGGEAGPHAAAQNPKTPRTARAARPGSRRRYMGGDAYSDFRNSRTSAAFGLFGSISRSFWKSALASALLFRARKVS